MSTDGLVEFVEARLDEDERIAREVEQRGPWRVAGSGYLFEENYGAFALDPHGLSVNGGEHVVRHDPARVLRDVEANRKVIELYEYAEAAWFADRDKPSPPTVHLGGWTIAKAALMALAGSWSDHPDYRSEWAD